MLTALPSTRQNSGESKRVWYFSRSLDMFVWFDADDLPYAFDLSYNTLVFQQDRTVSWHHERGYRHWKDETGRGPYRGGGVLAGAGPFDRNLVAAQFLAQCAELPALIANLVLQRLAAFELPPAKASTERHPVTRDSGAGHVAAPE